MKTTPIIFIIFSFFNIIPCFAQDLKEQEINRITELSCQCIDDIDRTLTKDQKVIQIQECIENSSITVQMENSLLNLKKIDSIRSNESKKDTITIKNKDLTINTKKYYTEVEDQLIKNCNALNNVYFSDETLLQNSISDKKNAQKLYKLGQNAFKKQHFKKALKYYRKAVQKDDTFAFAWDNLGYTYRKLKDYTNAIKAYEKSLKLDPKGKMPLMNIAVAYQLNNQLKEAKEAYKVYRNYYKDDPESFYGLGRIQFFEKDYKSALENMIQAFFLYKSMNSPYYKDAERHILLIYEEYKKQDNLEAFKTITDRFGLKFE